MIKRVLLVDDDPLVREIVAEMLNSFAIDIVEAADGAIAIDKFAQAVAPIDAVVLDIKMPKCNGWECLAALRARNATLPIVLCTGYSPETPPAGIDMSCTTLLNKPFRRNELLNALQLVTPSS